MNSTVLGDQTSPSVAIDENGHVAVAWQSFNLSAGDWDVRYVRLDSIGDTTPTSEELAHVATTGDQTAPRVAATAIDDVSANNGFVIAWQGPGPAVEGEEDASVDVYARRLTSTAALGEEFVVNAAPEKDQILPDVALDASGNAVFVWQVEGNQGSGSDVYGRRMNASGTLLGDEDFLVNVTPQRPQRLPSVAMDADGNFLVSWESQHQDGFSWGIYGRGYGPDGNPVGSEFAINHRVEGPQTAPAVVSNSSGEALVAWLGNSATHETSIFAHQFALPATEIGAEKLLTSFVGLEDNPPAAAMNADREAVVVWESYAEDGSGLGVFGQMLDADGNAMGGRFAVNEVTLANQAAPAVARAPNGKFVIAWQCEDEDGSGYGIYARIYSAAGVAGDVFRVNSITEGDQKAPAVAIAPDGRFIIVWESTSDDGSLDIKTQYYAADGTPIDGELLVNEFTGLDQYSPAITMNAAGQFVIAWVSDHPALEPATVDTEKSIFVRAFNSDWQPVCNAEALVHNFVKDAQEAPAVGIDASGRFVVAWQSINQDGNSWGVFARRFLPDMTPIERREFVVNETRMGPQRYVGLGVDEFGRFVVTWQSNERAELTDDSPSPSPDPNSPEGSSWDLYSRQYAFDSSHEGGELPVNQWQMGPQILPVVAQAPGGDFGIFWLGQGPDHVEGVHGRLYQSLFEFGDAPDPVGSTNSNYPTLLDNNGARHLPGTKLYLGTSIDVELDGQPSPNAVGDDTDANGDDEDGVALPTQVVLGHSTTITVTASAIGKLDAWIDFDQDGRFEAAEQIAMNLDLAAGANLVTFVVPKTAATGLTYARFRASSTGGLSPDGAAVDGEVEDYSVQVTPPGPSDIIVLGADAGTRPRVKVIDAIDGHMIASFLAYRSDFQGGVRVAVGDVNRDGTAEIIVAPGAGHSTLVKIFDLEGNELPDSRTKAYLGFTGGVFVATGDVNGDGWTDIIVSPDDGMAAEIKVFRNRIRHISEEKPYAFTKNPLQSFLAFGSTFAGGATVTAADFTADGKADILVGNGPGMGPRVRLFDLTTFTTTALAPNTLEIRPFKATDRGGVFVAAGNVKGDMTPEIVIGNGVDGRGRVEIYHATGARSQSITAYTNGEGRNAPVHVATKNVDIDVLEEILTAQGAPGSISRLRSFNINGSLVDDILESGSDFINGFFIA